MGSGCLPGLIRGPLGVPTNGLSLWGEQPAGLRRGHEHGATLGSTSENGKTKWGWGDTLGLLSGSFSPLPNPKAGASPSHLRLSPPACLSGPFLLPGAPLALQSHCCAQILPHPPCLFPQSHAHHAPRSKGCPHDPLRPSTSVWRAPSSGAWRRKRKTGRRGLSQQPTSAPWS